MPPKSELETEVKQVLQANTVQQATRVVRTHSSVIVLALISFVEAALPLPLLTDPFLVAAVLIDRTKTTRLVIVTTVASAMGGACAYFMALFFLDPLLSFISSGAVEQFYAMVNGTSSSTWILTLLGSLTPVPYTIVAWVIAVLEGSLLIFILGSIVGRGFRYAVVGYSTYRFGQSAISYAKRYLGFVSLILLGIAVLYFLSKM